MLPSQSVDPHSMTDLHLGNFPLLGRLIQSEAQSKPEELLARRQQFGSLPFEERSISVSKKLKVPPSKTRNLPGDPTFGDESTSEEGSGHSPELNQPSKTRQLLQRSSSIMASAALEAPGSVLKGAPSDSPASVPMSPMYYPVRSSLASVPAEWNSEDQQGRDMAKPANMTTKSGGGPPVTALQTLTSSEKETSAAVTGAEVKVETPAAATTAKTFAKPRNADAKRSSPSKVKAEQADVGPYAAFSSKGKVTPIRSTLVSGDEISFDPSTETGERMLKQLANRESIVWWFVSIHDEFKACYKKKGAQLPAELSTNMCKIIWPGRGDLRLNKINENRRELPDGTIIPKIPEKLLKYRKKMQHRAQERKENGELPSPAMRGLSGDNDAVVPSPKPSPRGGAVNSPRGRGKNSQAPPPLDLAKGVSLQAYAADSRGRVRPGCAESTASFLDKLSRGTKRSGRSPKLTGRQPPAKMRAIDYSTPFSDSDDEDDVDPKGQRLELFGRLRVDVRPEVDEDLLQQLRSRDNVQLSPREMQRASAKQVTEFPDFEFQAVPDTVMDLGSEEGSAEASTPQSSVEEGFTFSSHGRRRRKISHRDRDASVLENTRPAKSMKIRTCLSKKEINDDLKLILEAIERRGKSK